MIRIDKKEPDDQAWKIWCAKAKAERDRMVAEFKDGEKPKIDNDLYKAQKETLRKIFNDKCAFCEAAIGPGMHGDVEHFRPKGAVQEEDGSAAKYTDDEGKEREHPGYYWLAYDWRNLLLSCQLCNQPSAGGGGKRNYFPLKDPTNGEKPFRADKPGDEEREEPLFLHPWFDDPANHLRFDETGIVIPITPEGEACVKRMGLDREPLTTARCQVYKNARDKFNLYMGKARKDVESVKELASELLAWQEGKLPYSAPARAAIADEGEIAKERQRLLGL